MKEKIVEYQKNMIKAHENKLTQVGLRVELVHERNERSLDKFNKQTAEVERLQQQMLENHERKENENTKRLRTELNRKNKEY